MSDNILKVRSQQGTLTESEWDATNPVLLKGEVAISSNMNRMKVGDGSSTWRQLPYLDARNADSATNDGNGNNIDSIYEKKEQAVSRGVQLVTNGNATMGNNYNLSQLTFDGSQANGSGGSFTHTTLGVYWNIATDHFMMVNPDEYLRVTMDVKSEKGEATFFGVLYMYDVDKQLIFAHQVAYIPNTLTELTADLNPGDTIAKLKDVSQWQYFDEAYKRGFIFWNYRNSFGYQYPELTYSRNSYEWLFDKGGIDYSTNTIRLRVPWGYDSIPKGTKLCQCDSGGTFSYWGIVGGYLTKDWRTYSDTYLGTDYSGRMAGGKFRPGTAYVKLGFLWNYNHANDQIWVTNLFAYPIRPATTAENVPWNGVTSKPSTLAGYGIGDAYISGSTVVLGGSSIVPLTQHQDISGKADKAITLAGYGITDAKITSGTITLGGNSITPLTSHQDISDKADKATTLAGYGITDAKIANGVITLGSKTITPLTTHQSLAEYAKTSEVSTAISNAISGVTSFEYSVVDTLPATGKKGTIYLVNHGHGDKDLYDEYIWVDNTYEKIGNTDIDLSGYLQKTDISAWAKSSIKPSYAFSEISSKPTTISGYGITDAKIDSGVITLGSNTITPLISHQDISGKADKATTLAGYGITDAKIDSGVITLGGNTITPLTSHQSLSGVAKLAETNIFTGSQNIFKTIHRDEYYASNVCRHFYGGTPTQFVIWSKIQYLSGTHMPLVRIYGYAYGLNCPIEVKIGFYIYAGVLGWCGSISQGAWNPTVYLWKYTEGNVEYVAIGLDGECYFCGFQVDVQIGASGSFDTISVEGWKTSHNGESNNVPIIPALGTSNCIQVPKKAIATDITGNASYATTAGSASYASNVPWSGVSSKPTTLSEYGITDAYISSGAITIGGNSITPITQHQDISGKADRATTLAGYGITDAKISSGVITLGGNTITPLTSHQDISGKADKATTLAGYGIGDAYISGSMVVLGGNSIVPLTQHQDISGKADKATTLAGYGITDAKIDNGTITLGSNTITPLTSHLSLSEYAKTSEVSTAISNAISGVTSFEYSVVDTLPATGKKGTIYLVNHGHGDKDLYDEYIWVGNTYEKIGNTDIDLSGYLQKTDISAWAKASAKPSYAFSEITSKPTTVSGYGITDAKIESGVITLGGNTITPLTSHQSLSGVAKLAETNIFTGSQNIFKTIHRDEYYASNVCRHFYPGTPTQFVIWSKIRYLSGTHMPLVRIYGYAYGLNCPIEVKIGFYIYAGELGWSGSISQGAWNPTVYLWKYTEGDAEYVAIGLDGACYFCGFQVDVQVGASGAFDTIMVEGWRTSHNGESNDVPIIPAVGSRKCIEVPKKAIATDITGNANSANTVAWSGVSGRPSSLAGYGISDAYIASGTITLGSNTITPLTQHQDISGKADKSTTLAGYGITDAKIDAGVITLGGSTIKPLTKHQDISGKVDKVAGMGLSTNDYTTAEKNKLAGIASGATANTGTVTSVSAGNGLSGGTITSSGTISLKVASAGGLGGIVPMVDYTSDLPFEATNGDAIGSEVIADMAEKNTIALPIQVDAEGHAFVVIGEQLIEKLRALLGV